MRSPRAGRSVTPMRWRGRAAERSGRSAFAVGFAVQSLLALWLFERASNSRLQLQALSSSGPTFSLLYGQADHPAPTGERRRHSRGDSIPFGTRHTLLLSFAGIITINPLIHDQLPYDPAADLVPRSKYRTISSGSRRRRT